MKKVWVLERFIGREEMEKSLQEIHEMRKFAEEQGNADGIKAADEVKKAYADRMAKNPDGYWLGYQGKSIYKQFCQCAHETMRNLKGSQFRVVEGEIADDAKYWLGYKIVKENPGVMCYLYATL